MLLRQHSTSHKQWTLNAEHNMMDAGSLDDRHPRISQIIGPVPEAHYPHAKHPQGLKAVETTRVGH